MYLNRNVFWFDCVSSALILEDFIYFYYKYHWYNK
jgi:hypothetical protein